MGGQRKNSRHNVHWHCRNAPILSWHSATCCHTELRNRLSYPAAISQKQCSKNPHGCSTTLHAFKTHRSLLSSVHVLQLAVHVYHGAVYGSDRKKRTGETHEKFFHLHLDKMASHARVPALARHANSISQELETQHIMGNTTKLCHGCCSSTNFEQTSEKTKKSDAAGHVQNRSVLVQHTCPTRTSSELGELNNKLMTDFTLDTASPRSVPRVKL